MRIVEKIQKKTIEKQKEIIEIQKETIEILLEIIAEHEKNINNIKL